jgi:hypothetical protein
VLSVAPILALALVLQAQPEPPSATAPAADDPIGALIEQTAPSAAAPTPPPQPTMSAPPLPRPPPAASTTEDDGEEDPAAGLPSGPQPYVSPGPTPRPATRAPLYSAPLVRLPPRPQGALDGGWVLSRADGGGRLYTFQMNDLGDGREIEGAWRDLRQEWASVASGPLLSVGSDGAATTIRFFERGRSEPTVAVLRPGRSGEWTGEITESGAPVRVVMRRD